MAQFPDMTPTTNGDKMLIQAVNGHKLVFTRGAFGSGTLADNDDIKTFTALKSEKMSLPIVDTVLSDTGEKITLIFNCSNSSLDTGFINREIGIFAKLDDGNEVLYSYSNAGMAYDYIPSKETPTNENTFEVEVYISSEAEINVTIDGSIVYLTKAQVEEKINNHDKTTTAHAQAFAAHNDDSTAHSKLFGLCEKIANLGDDIIKKMALTTAITAISALTTDSWFGQLLKMVLTASGVRYLAEKNGYICLGSFWGNIIIQWGKALHGWVSFPVPYTSDRIVVLSHSGNEYMTTKAKEDASLTGFTLDVADNSTTFQDAQWGTFGYVNDGDYIAMPLSGTPLQVVVNDMADNTNPLCLSTLDYVEGKFKVRGSRIDSTTSQLWGHWIAVCK